MYHRECNDIHKLNKDTKTMKNYKTLSLVAAVALFGTSNFSMAVEFEPDSVEQTYGEADQTAPHDVEPAAGVDSAPVYDDVTANSDEAQLPYQ